MGCSTSAISRDAGTANLTLQLPLSFIDSVDPDLLSNDVSVATVHLKGDTGRLIFHDGNENCEPNNGGVSLRKPVGQAVRAMHARMLDLAFERAMHDCCDLLSKRAVSFCC